MLQKLASLLIFTSTLAIPAAMHGQSQPERKPTPNFELYGGYSYVFRTTDPTTNTFATSGRNGWDASMKIPILARSSASRATSPEAT